MAKNLILQPGYQFKAVVDDPAAPNSGDAVRVGFMTGVALLDEGDGGVLATETVVDFGPGIWDLPVTAESGAVAPGDAIYYDDAIDGLNNDSTGYFFGFALEAVASGTSTINVVHCPSPGAGTLGTGTVGSTQLANLGVTTGKLAAGVLAASSAGRALVAAGWLNVATALNAFGTDSIANAWLIQAITDGSFQADTATRALFADEIWTEAKITSASLTGLVAKVIADANVIGALPLIHRKTMASGADANIDILMTHKSRVINAWFVMKGAGTTGCTLQIKNVTTAITEAYNCASSSDKDVLRFASIDDAQQEITASTNLRISSHSTSGDFPGAEVYVEVVRV